MAEDDVFFGVGGERNFPPVLERVTLVIQFGEEFDDLRAVFAARFDQYCRAETLQQRAQLVHDDQLIPFDVALDEIEPLQPGEKLAAAPHPGGESDGALSGGIAHEVSSRAEITRFAGGVVAHGDLFILGSQRAVEDFDVAAAPQVAAQHPANDRDGFDGMDPACGADDFRERTGVIAQIGSDVDRRVAGFRQPGQVIDVFGRRAAPSKPQPVADEKEAAHRPQITFERKRPVEDFVEQRFHNGPGRN